MSRATHTISASIMDRMCVFESTDSSTDNGIGSSTNSQTQQPAASETGVSSGQHAQSRTEDSELQFGRARKMMMSSPPPKVQTDAEGLILPKKLINPCLESTDHKQLHRELKFNNKVGKSVLNQKSELQRAYEKQRERQQQHQAQDHSPTATLKGELNRVIMERAQKHEQAARGLDVEDEDEKQFVNPEYLNVRAKLRTGQRGELK